MSIPLTYLEITMRTTTAELNAAAANAEQITASPTASRWAKVQAAINEPVVADFSTKDVVLVGVALGVVAVTMDLVVRGYVALTY